jgi:hypothetical protein
MYKKIILPVLATLSLTLAVAQSDTLKFSLKNGNVTRSPNKDEDFEYSMPLPLSFSEDFKNKPIVLFNDKAGTDEVDKAVFETVIRPDANHRYNITINDGGVKLAGTLRTFKSSEFYLKLNNGPVIGPFLVKKAATVAGGGGGGSSVSVNPDYVPGYIYYDAIELSRLKKDMGPASVRQIKKIFEYYGITAQSDMNDFLKDEFGAVSFASVQSSGGGFISNIISSVGNVGVTNFADGIAKFLVERSKEELNVAFFRKFQEFLKKYPEIETVFPSTVSFINVIDIYNYAAMLPALRSAFQKDLNGFTKNLLELRDLTRSDCQPGNIKCEARLDKLHDFLNTHVAGRSLVAALLITDNLLEGNNAAEVLDNVANDPVCQEQDENFSNIVQFANLLSKSILNKDPDRVWISRSEASKLFTDEHILKTYIGLVFATAERKDSFHIKFNLQPRTLSLLEIFQKLHDKWDDNKNNFKMLLRQVTIVASDVTSAAKNIMASVKEGGTSILSYAEYTRSVADFLKQSFSLLGNFGSLDSGLLKLKKDIEKFEVVIEPALDACYDIKSQNYTALVLHISLVLAEMLNDNYKFRDEYIKYGTFMASVVEAKTSDDVKNAIEAAVLPVGSSSIKRETDFNISLNAFIGPFGGMEYLPKLKSNRSSFVMGVTAPVGVAFSFGKLGSSATRGGKSVSIFLPLIDVGSLATFRLSDDSSEVASEVKLKNIISPGLYLYYGFGKCPISLGIGGQLGPQLRTVTAKDINVDKNYYFRFGVNLTVDIPFFNFYTKNNVKDNE